MSKKHYYIAVRTKEIREISIDDNQVEYEVIANDDEIKEIQQLFDRMESNSKNTMQYIVEDPFDEWGADDERDEYEKHLETVYQRLFELGTESTKRKIHELGIMKE